MRKALWARGHRYRVNWKTPVGRADIAMPSRKVAIFIDGCFWHGCPDHYIRPRTRREFWSSKLRANVKRDQRQTAELAGHGWSVLRFWEHQARASLDEVVWCCEAAMAGETIPGGVQWRVLEAHPLDPEGTRERRVLVDLHVPARRRTWHGPRNPCSK